MGFSICCAIVLLHLTIIGRYSGGGSGADIGVVILRMLTNSNISVILFYVFVVLSVFWIHNFCVLSPGSIYLNY